METVIGAWKNTQNSFGVLRPIVRCFLLQHVAVRKPTSDVLEGVSIFGDLT